MALSVSAVNTNRVLEDLVKQGSFPDVPGLSRVLDDEQVLHRDLFLKSDDINNLRRQINSEAGIRCDPALPLHRTEQWTS